MKIAANGYAGNDGSVAFFPLYPLMVRWVGIVFDNNLVIAGILVSLACYFAAVYFLYRLVAARYGGKVAYRTCLYLSIFPTAFYWQAVYSESMFLMLSAACILWSTEARWKLAGLAGLAAALTRSAGFLLIVPMALSYYEQRDWKLRRTDSSAASLLMIPEGLMVWMAYLSLGFGKPLLFAQVQDQWRRYMAVPTFALWKSLEAAFQGARQLISGQTSHLYWPAVQPRRGRAAGRGQHRQPRVVRGRRAGHRLRPAPSAGGALDLRHRHDRLPPAVPGDFDAAHVDAALRAGGVSDLHEHGALHRAASASAPHHLRGVDRLVRRPHDQVRDLQLGRLTKPPQRRGD